MVWLCSFAKLRWFFPWSLSCMVPGLSRKIRIKKGKRETADSVYTLAVGVELQAQRQVFRVEVDLCWFACSPVDHPRPQVLQQECPAWCRCNRVVNCLGFSMQITSSLTLRGMKDRCEFQFVPVGPSLLSRVLICPCSTVLHVLFSFLTADPGPWQPLHNASHRSHLHTLFQQQWFSCKA